MTKINVGVIGCGRIADLHYLGYKNSQEAKIFAVCDTNAGIAEARKREWNAEKAYLDFRDILNDPQVDAVEILTPHHLHEKMVVEAAWRDKHIAVQKPMTNDLKSADKMLEAVRKAGVIFKVTENYVFYPPIVQARKMIENGEIGEPISLRIKYIGGSSGGWEVPSSSWEWRIKESLQGRGMVTFDHGHHLWSSAWFLMGEPEIVTAWIDSSDGIVDCPSVVIWKYRDRKAYGSCDFSYATDMHIPSFYYANDEWMEITGSRGIIFIRRCTGNIQSGAALVLFNGHGMKEFPEVPSDWSEGFLGATRNFIEAVRGREKPRLSGEEARTILKFSLAIQKSARKRREVSLEEMDSTFPFLSRFVQKRKHRNSCVRPRLWERIFPDRSEQYASQAGFLTEQLLQRFDPQAVPKWETVAGLRLIGEKGAPSQDFTLRIKDGKVHLEHGKISLDAVLTLTVPAGVWAAILLRKKRIGTAVILGKIKLEGRAEEALKLRAAFHL